MNRRAIAILFLLVISAAACEIDPARKKKARIKLVEKLTKEQTDSLSKDLDSLCLLHREEHFDRLVDSVLRIRLTEIREKVQPYE